MNRRVGVAALATVVAAGTVAVVALWPTEGAVLGALPACSTTLTPRSDVVAAVNAGRPNEVICFSAGTYRLFRTLSPKDGQTLRGAPGAVLSGAVVLHDWQRSGTSWVTHGALPAAYTDGGVCEDLARDDCRLAETVRIDGTVLERAPDRQSVTATSFYADYSTNDLYVGADPGRTAELARTRIGIMSGASHVTVEGFSIEGFASLYQRGAVMVCGPDWVVRDNTVTWNHNVGIQLARADHALVAGNTIVGNGETGISQWRSSDVTIDHNLVTGNNTGGYWISDGQSGGIKLAESSARIVDNTVSRNAGVGVWADSYCDGVTIAGNRITGNWADGVRFEISRGGVIRDNQVTGNALRLGRAAGTTLFSGGGINVSNARDVTVSDNDLAGNLNAVAVQDRTRSSSTPAGSYHLDGIVVRSNRIDLRREGAQVGVVSSSGSPGVTTRSAVRFDDNVYVAGETDAAFVVRSQHLTFQQWQQTGQDRNGVMGR